jgi:7,8-dihydropterin-6-yl-methyl-4-(beta-D-ribofuranosyl)aminobenzene 5'-phosphate synthase
MDGSMSRRDFLRATAITGAVVLANDFLKTSSWADGVVNIPEAESITITVITDNYATTQEPNYKIAKRPARITSYLDNALHGEHGLAYQVETVVGGQSHSCLFDFATDAQGVMRNMKLLKIDLSKVEALGVSHPHWDHCNALIEILTANKDRFRKGIPFYVGEQFFEGTYSKLPNGNIISLSALTRQDLEKLDLVRVVEVRDPTAIIPGVYLPGKVERVTEYEQIPASLLTKKGNDFVQEMFPGTGGISQCQRKRPGRAFSVRAPGHRQYGETGPENYRPSEGVRRHRGLSPHRGHAGGNPEDGCRYQGDQPRLHSPNTLHRSQGHSTF